MYGVATVGRIDKIIGLFCKRAPYKRLYSAKETYNFKEPTDRSHPICEMTHSSTWRDPSTRVTWLIHMCNMTRSHVWHDPFMCVTWLIRICDVTHSYMWHWLFTRVIRLIHVCDMTHSYVWYITSSCLCGRVCLSLCLCVCVRVCTCGSVCVCMCVCVYACTYILERCHGGTRWAHGCGAQCTQVWVVDTRRGGGTPSWSLIEVY